MYCYEINYTQNIDICQIFTWKYLVFDMMKFYNIFSWYYSSVRINNDIFFNIGYKIRDGTVKCLLN